MKSYRSFALSTIIQYIFIWHTESFSFIFGIAEEKPAMSVKPPVSIISGRPIPTAAEFMSAINAALAEQHAAAAKVQQLKQDMTKTVNAVRKLSRARPKVRSALGKKKTSASLSRKKITASGRMRRSYKKKPARITKKKKTAKKRERRCVYRSPYSGGTW